VPVFVTHADTPIGLDLVQALVADGADVRAFADGAGDVAAVRAAGAVVAVGDHDDEGHLEAAMTHAHTVVVPRVGWMTDPDEVTATWPVIVRAAVQADVVRIVAVSLLDAAPDAEVPVLAALGRVEASLLAAPPQTLVVRTDGVVEDGHADIVAAVASGEDACPDAVMAPVARADLVAGLVALDAARSGRSGGHALFTALGAAATVAATSARAAGRGDPADVASSGEARGGGAGGDGAGTRQPTLVGRRWMPPARRHDLVRAICGRGAPTVVGADLWELVP
jgi:uncharacterized protein YbjT (DUF2867 family)